MRVFVVTAGEILAHPRRSLHPEDYDREGAARVLRARADALDAEAERKRAAAGRLRVLADRVLDGDQTVPLAELADTRSEAYRRYVRGTR